jgi:hypothetical protein
MIMNSIQGVLNRLRHSLEAPSRGPRTAVVIGRLLAAAFLICFGTGIFSHFLQDPLPWMVFPTRPIWIYQVSQGVHITAGILCFPLLFAKLYAVFPELFQTPPIKSFPNLLERASIALFVASSIVQIVIGLLNTYQWYALFPFPFRQTHYALSFVIIGSLAIHIAVKLPVISRYWTKGRAAQAERVQFTERVELVETSQSVSTSSTRQGGSTHQGGLGRINPRTSDPVKNALDRVDGVTGRVFDWIDATPRSEPRASRRGFLTIVGVAGAALVALTAGQSFKLFDATNVFGPRKQGVGPQSLPVNRTAARAGVEDVATDERWTLTVFDGDTSKSYAMADLQAMPQHEVVLPIACVEGWSQYATWKGVRLSDLVDSVGATGDRSLRATSLEQNSSYAIMTMGPEYVRDPLTLVALELNGSVLDLDHGYPARMIAPGRPGVLQTKWLSTLEVLS